MSASEQAGRGVVEASGASFGWGLGWWVGPLGLIGVRGSLNRISPFQTEPMCPDTANIDFADVKKYSDTVLKEVSKVIVGYEDIMRDFLICLSSGGHILLEGVPGIAKTTLAKTFTTVSSLEYNRVQFTQDLLPSDVTGHYYFNQKEGQFDLRKGPIFSNLILADEINRAPPKTQSALLESMEEVQVTIEGNTFKLPRHFMVIATINPIEAEGVYPLPEAQLDRFMFKTKMGYLPEDKELKMLKRKVRQEAVPPEPHAMGLTMIDAMKDLFPKVKVDDRIIQYVRDIIITTRGHDDIVLGASPRAGEQMIYAAQGSALIQGRNFVLPDDVKRVAYKVLNHRLMLSVEAEMDGKEVEGIITDVLGSVKVPKS